MRLVPEHVREATAAFRVVFRSPHLRLVANARLASVTGRWAATVALAVVAYRRGGTEAVGLLGVIRILPAATAGPLAASLLGRFRSDRLLLVAGVARTLAIGGAGAALLAGAGLVPVFVLVAAESLLSTMVRPLQTAALPFLARSPGELTAANLTLTTIESSGMLFGPLLSSALLAVSSPGTALLVTALAYAYSTAAIARIPAWERSGDDAAPLESFGGSLSGVREIQRDVNLRLVAGLYCVENLIAGCLNVFVVVAALQLLDLGDAGVGVLNAAIGGGGVLGAVGAAALLRRGRVAANFAAGLMLFGAPIVLVAAAPGTAATLFLLGVLGAGVALVDFAAVTLLQRAIPDELLARVFSILQSVFVATLGIGALIAPLLVSALGIRGALLASGVVLPILAALLWRPLIGLDTGYVGPEAALEMLRASTIFAPLDLATLERLARSMTLREVSAGTTVMRQGDPGDLYYLVADGELRVDIDGDTVNNLAPGDGFGEIALLRDIPRTASVVALTDVRLWSLDRETFVDAVSGSASSRSAADALIDTRLAALRADLATV